MKKKIQLSDHAFVRYLERYAGLDVDQMKKTIINAIKKDIYFKNGIFKTDYGQAILKDNVIVTFVPNGQQPKYKKDS